jgi:hypothetical protein
MYYVILVWVRTSHFSKAFEYSKREFAGVYGPNLPVWALLASGATGGVRLATSLFGPPVVVPNATADCVLDVFLPVR